MAQESSFKLTIDARERYLATLFAEGTVKLSTLELGDILCEYEDGSSWIVERKTTSDSKWTNETTCTPYPSLPPLPKSLR